MRNCANAHFRIAVLVGDCSSDFKLSCISTVGLLIGFFGKLVFWWGKLLGRPAIWTTLTLTWSLSWVLSRRQLPPMSPIHILKVTCASMHLCGMFYAIPCLRSTSASWVAKSCSSSPRLLRCCRLPMFWFRALNGKRQHQNRKPENHNFLMSYPQTSRKYLMSYPQTSQTIRKYIMSYPQTSHTIRKFLMSYPRTSQTIRKFLMSYPQTSQTIRKFLMSYPRTS